jgi:hypothetical protein
MAENARLHEIVLSLENSIAQNLSLCSELTTQLFPELTLRRWNLPFQLPELAPRKALEVQIQRLRQMQDFKVTQTELQELPPGGISELKVFNGIEPAVKLTGPSLILRAAHEEFQKRAGRPWRETSERLSYPTDVRLLQDQLREVVKMAERQLEATREHLAVMDQIFCCLFGLAANFTDEGARQTIRHHLSPDDGRIAVQFAPARETGFRPAGSGSPIGLLQ